MVQVRDTLEKAKQWERDTLSAKFGDNLGIRLAFTESEALEFKPHTTQSIVERLQPTVHDFVGDPACGSREC